MKQAEVQFIVEKNEGRSSGYSIAENPNTKHETVRSLFDSEEDARKRELEISDWWGFKAVEIKTRTCKCPSNYHTMFSECRGY